MLNNYMGIVLLGIDDTDIRGLTKNRSIASIPIGGRYRVIDFALSNLTNAGVTNIGIFTKDQGSRSLLDHLGNGKSWDLDRKRDGLFIFQLSHTREGITDLKNLKNNLEYLYRSKEKYIVLTSAHMICNLDIEDMINYHEKSKCDMTIAYKKIGDEVSGFENCDTLKVDDNGRVTNIGKNLMYKKGDNISTETFVLKKDKFIKIIAEATQRGDYFHMKDVLTSNFSSLTVAGYEFDGYIRCVNSTKQYYELSQDLLDANVRRDLFFKNGRIFTRTKDTPPSKFTTSSDVKNSLVANGAYIAGKVVNSIISRHVEIQEGAEIEDCIILQDCKIEKGVKLKNIIVDKNTTIKEGEELRASKDFPLVIEKKLGMSPEVFKDLYWPLDDM